MKTIKLSYSKPITETFKVPQSGKWYKFFKAWEKNEYELTDSDWNILEELSLAKFIELNTGIPACQVELSEISVENYT